MDIQSKLSVPMTVSRYRSRMTQPHGPLQRPASTTSTSFRRDVIISHTHALRAVVGSSRRLNAGTAAAVIGLIRGYGACDPSIELVQPQKYNFTSSPRHFLECLSLRWTPVLWNTVLI